MVNVFARYLATRSSCRMDGRVALKLGERIVFRQNDGFGADGNGDVQGFAYGDAQKTRLGDADDFEGMAVERNRLAENIVAAAVGSLPEIVAEDGGAGAASLVVGDGESAAEDGVHAEGFEILAADAVAERVTGFP